MFKATCSTCGNPCEVPFKPTRPVQCSSCFGKDGNEAGDSRRPSRPSFGRPSFGRPGFNRPNRDDRPMFDAVCSSCGDACKVPFEPRSGKPVYCRNCFDKAGDSGTRRSDDYRGGSQQQSISGEQFAVLNKKIDTVLAMITKLQSPARVNSTPEDIVGEPPVES